MSERILIPFGDRFLALDSETFQAALAEGDRLLPPRARPDGLIGGATPSKLLTAGDVARELGVAVSKVRELVRRAEIPVVRVGRFHRFDLAAVRQALDRLPPNQSVAEKRPLDQRVTGDGFTRVSPFRGGDRGQVGARNGR